MFKLRPDHLSWFFLVTSLGGLACSDSGMADVEVVAATSTSGASTAPDGPTNEADGDGPTPTTTITTTTAGAGSTDDDTGMSSEGTSTTTGGVSSCGDGVVAPDEECDDGLVGNDDSRFCTANCQLNVCGDGKLFVGWELCDEGQGNSDEYGSLCGSQCLPGARCGDHKLQAEFETCDLGLDNGGVKGDEQGILCDASCRAQQLRGFVTAAAFSGDLGGFFGADLKCSDAATAAGLSEPERFHALLSSGDVDAKTRFSMVAASQPYVLVTGKKFADNFAALVEAGPLGEGIAVTETGAHMYKRNVATNTAPGGIRYSPDQHCQGWTSAAAAHDARIGINAVPVDAPEWLEWKSAQAWIGMTKSDCDNENFHLYCLEI